MSNKAAACFHCGEPIVGKNWPANTPNGPVDSCCIGCKTVTETIFNLGFDDYYQLRDQPASKADIASSNNLLDFLQNDENRQSVIAKVDEQSDSAQLFIEDIRCAACVWLLETTLLKIAGVQRVSINLSQRTASIQWQHDTVELSDILTHIHSLGYSVQPLTQNELRNQISRVRTQQLWRVGIAGLFTMQTMMLSTGLYAGEFYGIDFSHRSFLRLASAILTIPVLFYSGLPILRSGLRAISHRTVNMDVPVSAALLIAFGFSVFSTATEGEHVYFDTACMFVFFLSLSRLLQYNIELRTHTAIHQLVRQFDQSVTVLKDAETTQIPLNKINIDDTILVRSGETIPVDGAVASGCGEVDESVLNGEFSPIHKTVGDTVFAGSISHAQPLTITVLRAAAQSRLARLNQLSLDALNSRPQIVEQANRTATWFSAALIVIAVGTAIFWTFQQADNTLAITLSVLIITCPCALALAIPSAITASINNMLSNGLLVTDSHVIETLPTITDIIVDKTGTLTHGEFKIQNIRILGSDESNKSADKKTVCAIAAAIERGSTHPIARAFAPFAVKQTTAENIRHANRALSATVDGISYQLGEFDALRDGVEADPASVEPSQAKRLFLATQSQWVAEFELDDVLRPDAVEFINYCQDHGKTVHLLSGDESQRVSATAQQLGINDSHAEMSAEDKLQYIQQLQQQNKHVLAIGDGFNDAPVLAAANIGVAMGSGSDLSLLRANAVILNDRLLVVARALDSAVKTKTIIRQNLLWAIGYNAIALPFAIAGVIPPWLAAIGMSASSLIVTLNSTRLLATTARANNNPISPSTKTLAAES